MIEIFSYTDDYDGFITIGVPENGYKKPELVIDTESDFGGDVTIEIKQRGDVFRLRDALVKLCNNYY